MINMVRRRPLITFILLFIAALLFGRGSYIQSKALLAQYLITSAWEQQLTTGVSKPPWPWADTSPIAQLTLPNQESLTVLAGVSGRNLAFGPTIQQLTAMPDETGNIVIYGHNDTHFRSLENAKINDQIRIVDRYNAERTYRITSIRIVDMNQGDIAAQTPWDQLTLITCYPFSPTVINGPLRFVVTAAEDK